MAAVASLSWYGTVKGDSGENNVYTASGVKIWTVTGATDEDGALSASGVAQLNDGWDNANNSYVLCKNRTCRTAGFNVFEVTANFQIPPNGAFVLPTANPLNYPTQIDFKSVVEEIPFDRDINNNPVVNANGDPIQNPAPTKTIVKHTLRLIKNFSFFDYVNLKQYENKVNSDTLLFQQPNGQSTSFVLQTVKCNTIQPVTTFKKTDTFVPVGADFEIYTLDDSNVTKPHQFTALHVGSTGFYSGSGGTKTGRFVHSRGHEIQGDVLLYTNGTPYDETLMVQNADELGTPIGSTLTVGGTFTAIGDSATVLTYLRYNSIAMSPLLSMFS